MERSLMLRSSGVQGVQEFEEGKRAGTNGNVLACRRVGVSAYRRVLRRSTIFIANAVPNSVSSVGAT
jgi:hypothetical protein